MRLYKTILTLLLIFLQGLGNAQNSQTDSLKNILANAKEDTNKVNTLLLLSKEALPEDAMSYSVHAKDLAEKLNYQRGVASALKSLGFIYFGEGRYKEVLSYWNQSLHVFESIGDEIGVSNMLNNLGSVYFNQGEDVGALEYYLKSLKVAEKTGDKLRITTALQNIGAVYFNKPSTRDKALQYYLKAMPISEQLKNNDAIGTIAANIGEIYVDKNEDSLALYYLNKSLKAFGNSEDVPYTLNIIGKLYRNNGNFSKAIEYHQKALAIAQKFGKKLDIAQTLIGLGNTHLAAGNNKLALSSFNQGQSIARAIHANYELRDVYTGLADTYNNLSDYKNAYKYQALLTNIKDTLYNAENDKKLSLLLSDFEIQKKQAQIDLLTKDKAFQNLNLRRQQVVKSSLIFGLILILIIAVILLRGYRSKAKTNKLLDQQKLEIENLLLNMLPAEVANELQQYGYATPKNYDSVTVMFTDFKNFTKIADTYSPKELVAQLNEYFIAFDGIIEKYNLEKIKTIGDSYMCAGGINSYNVPHAIQVIKASMEILDYINKKNEERINTGLPLWSLRIGVHTGPLIAGVVGRKKYAYDIWGSTVNIASRMESNGEPGKVNISAATYNLIKNNYNCSYRGQIFAKNIGEIDMYFVEQEVVEKINSELAMN